MTRVLFSAGARLKSRLVRSATASANATTTGSSRRVELDVGAAWIEQGDQRVAEGGREKERAEAADRREDESLGQ